MARTTTYLTLDSKGRTTLPEEVREELGVGPGDFLILDKTEHGTYELVPAELVPKEDLWHFHPEFRERLAEAKADIEAGRFHHGGSPEEFAALRDSWSKEKGTRRRKG